MPVRDGEECSIRIPRVFIGCAAAQRMTTRGTSWIDIWNFSLIILTGFRSRLIEGGDRCFPADRENLRIKIQESLASLRNIRRPAQ
jgi:hypothetical protein